MPSLVDVLADAGDSSPFLMAAIAKVNSDGTVDLALDGGTALGVGCLSSYAPRTGESVLVVRRSRTDLVVLGTLRTSNATTVDVEGAVTLAWNIVPGTGSLPNPLTVTATGTASHNSREWVSERLYQGAYSTGQSYRSGLIFYGSGFDAARSTGIRVTRARLELSRPSEGGSSSGRPFYVAGHQHAGIPSGAPLFTTGATAVGSWAWGETETVDIPVGLGQGLVDGTIRGLGCLYLGTAQYAIFKSRAEYANQGRLILDWE